MLGLGLHRFAVLLALGALVLVLAANALVPLPPTGAIVRDCLMQLLFAATVALAVRTSSGWRAPAVILEDGGVPSLRSLAWVTPVAFLVQIFLGAGYRYLVFGAMAHVVWALAAALIAIMTASFVLSQFPQHRPLRLAAGILITLTSVQIVLGIAALWARLALAGSPNPTGLLAYLPFAHIGCGALVFASSIVLSQWILRDVRTVRAQARRSGNELIGSGRHS
jgi:hypothetical protein